MGPAERGRRVEGMRAPLPCLVVPGFPAVVPGFFTGPDAFRGRWRGKG